MSSVNILSLNFVSLIQKITFEYLVCLDKLGHSSWIYVLHKIVSGWTFEGSVGTAQVASFVLDSPWPGWSVEKCKIMKDPIERFHLDSSQPSSFTAILTYQSEAWCNWSSTSMLSRTIKIRAMYIQVILYVHCISLWFITHNYNLVLSGVECYRVHRLLNTREKVDLFLVIDFSYFWPCTGDAVTLRNRVCNSFLFLIGPHVERCFR